MGETSKVNITASRIIAFIAVWIVLRESISYFYFAAIGPVFALSILWGILALIIAVYLFISVKIVSFKKIPLPYN